MVSQNESLNQKKRLTIPLFPLTNAVLFPKTYFSLYVFEKRYVALVQDVMRGDHLIGIVLLKKGWHHDYFGHPDIYNIGTVGEVQQIQQLNDGTYNILLHGIEPFSILKEIPHPAYRRADVELLPAPLLNGDEKELLEEKISLIRAFNQLLAEGKPEDTASMTFSSEVPYDELVNTISHALDHLVSRKQKLLEEIDIRKRQKLLIQLIQWRILQNKITPLLDENFEGSSYN